MSSVRLGPTSYVVLGTIALRGASTPYDLKRFVETTLGHFWAFPHSQLYAEPARLAEAGLLDEDREDGAPTRSRRPERTRSARGWVSRPPAARSCVTSEC
jgi:PadR family transcriptional regulator, regulatory protein AphA